jgi:S-adenosylmethionine decarboxylase proenzyme
MLAKHFKIELHDCNSTALNDVPSIHEALNLVANILGVKVIKTSHHLFVPHGITCLFLVSSSHFALHSWPEHKFVMVDIFICGERVPINECIEQLKMTFEPTRTELSILECGREY